MKYIQLTHNRRAIVDDDMYDELNRMKWHCSTDGYAVRSQKDGSGRYIKIRMHRLVAKTPDGMETDHINGDKLDNRASNLRACNESENQANRGLPINNISGYKGVVWHKRDKVWQASIVVGGRVTFLGTYHDKQEAARAYNRAAKEHFGAFAKLNVA